jgi:hypothetical protein
MIDTVGKKNGFAILIILSEITFFQPSMTKDTLVDSSMNCLDLTMTLKTISNF